MKAVLCRAFGEPDSLRAEEIETRPLERGQVRISVRAAGVNFPDYLMVTGNIRLSRPYHSRPASKLRVKSSNVRRMSRISVPVSGFSHSRDAVAHLHRNSCYQRRSLSRFRILWISSRRPVFQWPTALRILR
jgi:hypothetical protein